MDYKKAILQLKAMQKMNPKNLRLAGEGWKKDWQYLIAIMLSAQTRDTKTIEVCEKLFEKYPSIQTISKLTVQEIEKEISSINYYKTKSKNMVTILKFLSKNEIPETIEKLIELPGVGRKTANVFLSETGKAMQIGVDTHVFRIAKKLGWAKSEKRDKVEEELKELFPKEYWNEINPTLVKFGQTYGRSQRKEDEILKKIK